MVLAGRSGSAIAVVAAAAGMAVTLAGCSSSGSSSSAAQSPSPSASAPASASAVPSASASAGGSAAPSPAGALPSSAQTPQPAASGQLTGTELESILLPASDFPAGYAIASGSPVSSGGSLTSAPATYRLATMSCATFVEHLGSTGFGETAMVSGSLAATGQAFDQLVYQFAAASGAAGFVSGVQSLAGRCASFTVSASGSTGTLALKAAPAAAVGGHPAVAVTESGTLSGKKIELNLLLSASGADVFGAGSVGAGVAAPTQPATATIVYTLMRRQAAAALLG